VASNQSTPAQRKISVVIALVLLSACAAKAWAMVWLTIPVTRLESFFNVLIIQLELVLALWLLSRIRMPLSLLASAIFFLFAVASNLYAIWRGKSSCGCFGNNAATCKGTESPCNVPSCDKTFNRGGGVVNCY